MTLPMHPPKKRELKARWQELEALLKLLQVDRDGVRLKAALSAARAAAPSVRVGLECSLVYILDYFDLQELLRLSQVSHLFRDRVKSRLLTRFVRTLRRWVDGPTELRDVLRNTGSVVSGSTALAYALDDNDKEDWESNDLDIYTPVGEPCQDVLRHLTEQEGFELQPRPNADVPGAPPPEVDPPIDVLENYEGSAAFSRLRNVYKLSKDRDGKKVCIDVIEARGTSAIIPIFRFHSSLVMNYISADALFMAYPTLTLSGEFIVNQKLNRFQLKSREWLDKYEGRGFKQWRVKQGKPCGSACYPLMRSTRDVACLQFTFGQEGGVFDEAQWTMSLEDFPMREGSCGNWCCPKGATMMATKDGTTPRWKRVAVLGSNSLDENGKWVNDV